MRFLDAPDLTRLSALLQHLDVGDRVIRGRLELLSTSAKSSTDRRLLREIEKEMSSSPLFLASSPPPILLSSPPSTSRSQASWNTTASEYQADEKGEGKASENSDDSATSGRKRGRNSLDGVSRLLLPPRARSRSRTGKGRVGRSGRRKSRLSTPSRGTEDDPSSTSNSDSSEKVHSGRRSEERAGPGRKCRRGRKDDSVSEGDTDDGPPEADKKEETSDGRLNPGVLVCGEREQLGEKDRQDVLVNLIGTLNQCFPDYEFCSALTPAMFEQAAQLQEVEAEINQRLCVVERVVPGFLQQLWCAIKASIRLDHADIYRHRVGSSDDPAPMVPYDPTLSSVFRGPHRRQGTFALPAVGNRHLKPPQWGQDNDGWRLDNREEAVAAAECTNERGREKEQNGSIPGCRGNVSRQSGGMSGAGFPRRDSGAICLTTECGGGWSQASISLFSVFFFFHDRKEEKLLFFSCSCTCKAAGGGGEEETEGLEEDDMGDIYVTRAAFGVDDCAGTHADEEEVCDDEDDPDTFSDLELPSPACANA
ncbi:maf1 regulator [Cystoisospora suis]|uniref:Maf1 regulator n=1 Tax=Cystoisospora suis TaxID=483139 RepID=A0A2C6L5Y7_9APIC|nr:maf1 regulator [Cystoisospora suis]